MQFIGWTSTSFAVDEQLQVDVGTGAVPFGTARPGADRTRPASMVSAASARAGQQSRVVSDSTAADSAVRVRLRVLHYAPITGAEHLVDCWRPAIVATFFRDQPSGRRSQFDSQVIQVGSSSVLRGVRAVSVATGDAAAHYIRCFG
jgi:hypothetical protein